MCRDAQQHTQTWQRALAAEAFRTWCQSADIKKKAEVVQEATKRGEKSRNSDSNFAILTVTANSNQFDSISTGKLHLLPVLIICFPDRFSVVSNLSNSGHLRRDYSLLETLPAVGWTELRRCKLGHIFHKMSSISILSEAKWEDNWQQVRIKFTHAQAVARTHAHTFEDQPFKKSLFSSCILSWCCSFFDSHLAARCVFPYFLCVLWCHCGRSHSKIDPRQHVTDQAVWLANVFCEHIVFICELACLFVWCAARSLPSFFINCEYLDLLDKDLTSDVQMSLGVSGPRDTVNGSRIWVIYTRTFCHNASRLLSFHFFIYLSFSLLSVSLSSPHTACKSALNHSLTERGEGEGI